MRCPQVVSADLAEAEPALARVRARSASTPRSCVTPRGVQAKEMVSGIKKSHLDELRSLAQPPRPVQVPAPAASGRRARTLCSPGHSRGRVFHVGRRVRVVGRHPKGASESGESTTWETLPCVTCVVCDYRVAGLHFCRGKFLDGEHDAKG